MRFRRPSWLVSIQSPGQPPRTFRPFTPPLNLALALSVRFIRLRSEDAEAMTKWAKLTDEDKARLREVDAEQRADEAAREADKWTRNALKMFVIVGVFLWLLGVAVWLLVVLL